MADTKARTGDIVMVMWLDAYSDSEWKPAKEHIHSTGSPALSVGIILKLDKQAVSIAQTADAQGLVADVLTVPRPLIQSIKVLFRKDRVS